MNTDHIESFRKRSWTSCLGHGTPKLEFFFCRAAAIVFPMRGECPRSLNGFELFLWPQLFNRTLSRNSKERFNWRFFSFWSRLSVWLLPASFIRSGVVFHVEHVFHNFFFLCSIKKVPLKMLDLWHFFVKLSEYYSPARKWKFRQSRHVTCKGFILR